MSYSQSNASFGNFNVKVGWFFEEPLAYLEKNDSHKALKTDCELNNRPIL